MEIDAILRAQDHVFYQTFPHALPDARSREVEAAHARLFGPPACPPHDPAAQPLLAFGGLAEYTYPDPATSWAYYPPQQHASQSQPRQPQTSPTQTQTQTQTQPQLPRLTLGLPIRPQTPQYDYDYDFERFAPRSADSALPVSPQYLSFDDSAQSPPPSAVSSHSSIFSDVSSTTAAFSDIAFCDSPFGDAAFVDPTAFADPAAFDGFSAELQLPLDGLASALGTSDAPEIDLKSMSAPSDTKPPLPSHARSQSQPLTRRREDHEHDQQPPRRQRPRVDYYNRAPASPSSASTSASAPAAPPDASRPSTSSSSQSSTPSRGTQSHSPPARDRERKRGESGSSSKGGDPAKKPPLACLFCRGRKIACGPPVSGLGLGTSGCNQCQRRSLECVYPQESRRGMRKKKPTDGGEAAPTSASTAGGSSSRTTSPTASEVPVLEAAPVPVSVPVEVEAPALLETRTRDPRLALGLGVGIRDAGGGKGVAAGRL